MARKRVTLTVDRDVAEQAREAAGPMSLATYVERALQRQLQRDRLIAFLDETSSERGHISESVMADARRDWR